MAATLPSDLAKKYEHFLLRQKGARDARPATAMPSRAVERATMAAPMDKGSIEQLKEFYLQRLAKSAKGVPPHQSQSVLGPRPSIDGGRSTSADSFRAQLSGPNSRARSPCGASGGNGTKDIEDLDVMCNNCLNLIKVTDASSCTGQPSTCPVASRFTTIAADTKETASAVSLLDLKLRKLRENLEAKLADPSIQVHIMRHLTQLRYHIDTALKWTGGSSELGMLCGHTLQQLKQLTSMARAFEPAIYIFSKRVENVVCQKERELRRVAAAAGKALGSRATSSTEDPMVSTTSTMEVSLRSTTLNSTMNFDANSAVDLDSDCGTQRAETVVTQDQMQTGDVGNMQDANEYLSAKSEDEQRRWFYSQCLAMKLACEDKAKSRRILISDLYAKVRAQGIPEERWSDWIRQEVLGDGDGKEAPGSDVHISSADSGGTGAPPVKSSSPSGVRSSSSTGCPGASTQLFARRYPAPQPQQPQQPSSQGRTVNSSPPSSLVAPAMQPQTRPSAGGAGLEMHSQGRAGGPQVVWTPRSNGRPEPAKPQPSQQQQRQAWQQYQPPLQHQQRQPG